MLRLCLRRFAAVTPLLVLACGCTKTKVFTTAPIEPGADTAVTRRAPRDAVYKLKWFDLEKGELNTIHGTDHVVFAGQRIGFAPHPDGGLLAFAGDDEFQIDRLNRRAAYYVWVAKVKKETMLARRMRQAGNIAVAGSRVAAESALTAADSYLSGDGDDECVDDDGAGLSDEYDGGSTGGRGKGKDKGKGKKHSHRDKNPAPAVPAGPVPPAALQP
jgi:hypothetical protein